MLDSVINALKDVSMFERLRRKSTKQITLKEPLEDQNQFVVGLRESPETKPRTSERRAKNIYHEYEYAEKLIDIEQRITEYNFMRKSDSQIGGLMKVLKLPIRSATWSITGGREDIRLFIETNLKEELTQPFNEFLRLTLTFMDFGFSTFEKVFQWDPATGYFKWVKFQFLPHATIYKIVGFPNGDLKKVVQNSTDDSILGEGSESMIAIPAKYILLFVNEKEGDFYGTSVFRNAFGNYKMKDTLIKIDAIRHDRYGVGVPWMRLRRNYKQDDLDVATNVLQNMRSHEYSYMIIPPGIDGGLDEGFGILNAEGTGTDIIKSVNYHDEAMSKSVLAQFIDLGTSQSGNRALGESFIDLYVASLNGYVEMVQEVFNLAAIKQLVDFNWGVQEEYPKLQFEEIKAADIVDISEALKNFTESGWLHPNIDDENQVRTGLGLKEIKEEDEGAEGVAAKEFAEGKTTATEGHTHNFKTNDDGDGQTTTTSAGNKHVHVIEKWRVLFHGDHTHNIPAKERTFKDLLTEGQMFRELKGDEIHVDWFGMAEKIETMKQRFIRKVKKVRDRQIRSLVYDLVRDKKPVEKVKPKFVDQIEKAFMEFQKEAFGLGAREVKKEKAKSLSQNIDGFNLQEPEIPLEIMKQLEFASIVGAEEISSRTANSIKNQILSAAPLDLSDRQLQAQLFQNNLDTGERVIGGQFGKVITAFGAGRAEAALSESTGGGFYSAILDGNTCEVCADADSNYNAGTRDEPYELNEMPPAPNPACEGTINRCRCIHVYQFFIERGEET